MYACLLLSGTDGHFVAVADKTVALLELWKLQRLLCWFLIRLYVLSHSWLGLAPFDSVIDWLFIGKVSVVVHIFDCISIFAAPFQWYALFFIFWFLAVLGKYGFCLLSYLVRWKSTVVRTSLSSFNRNSSLRFLLSFASRTDLESSA